ncbi:Multifunctional methyltransferase subunit TRM112-like protein [Thelohanellus kitauei]|uniref:Multifunctional methyltransferase subunit TRM112-like protein n=1 Tax=Thelohanellus kitauei TaxID=669202 RepID=A0A0C2MM82_THEKT|nr:Multifunctional methyltransferase subunit TRM112-like protein [Thelohanellus kitauei]
MKLLVHNILKSNDPASKIGYPLKLQIDEKTELHINYNANTIKNLLTKIDYGVLCDVSRIAGYDKLPDMLPSPDQQDEEFLKMVHHALLEIDVVEGSLEDPDTGRVYQIHNGIPNMIIEFSHVKF